MSGNKAKKDLITAAEIAEQFPLHILVWNNQTDALVQKLASATKVSRIVALLHQVGSGTLRVRINYVMPRLG